MAEKPTPEVIGTFIPEILNQYRTAMVQVRAGLFPDEKIIIIGEGYKFYDAGVRAVYHALCLMDIKENQADPKQIASFKKGLEEFLRQT
ncbi:MAG: hypothetical protein AABW50_05260 [Nanoarchaeota archaeon]